MIEKARTSSECTGNAHHGVVQDHFYVEDHSRYDIKIDDIDDVYTVDHVIPHYLRQ